MVLDNSCSLPTSHRRLLEHVCRISCLAHQLNSARLGTYYRRQSLIQQRCGFVCFEASHGVYARRDIGTFSSHEKTRIPLFTHPGPDPEEWYLKSCGEFPPPRLSSVNSFITRESSSNFTGTRRKEKGNAPGMLPSVTNYLCTYTFRGTPLPIGRKVVDLSSRSST